MKAHMQQHEGRVQLVEDGHETAEEEEEDMRKNDENVDDCITTPRTHVTKTDEMTPEKQQRKVANEHARDYVKNTDEMTPEKEQMRIKTENVKKVQEFDNAMQQLTREEFDTAVHVKLTELKGGVAIAVNGVSKGYTAAVKRFLGEYGNELAGLIEDGKV